MVKTQIIHGEALDVLPLLAGSNIDMIFCDPPYGTTYAAWDKVIDFEMLWNGLRSAVTRDAAMVFTAVQPFTSLLVCSNLKEFKIEWIWDKVNASNFANAKRQPMKVHESVLVFSQGTPPYYPIMVPGKPNHVQGKNANNNESTLRKISGRVADDLSGMKYPKSIQTFPKHSSQSKYHPTQKPLDLCEYFIKTYTREDAIILDPTMGSGSTGVAALRCGRRFIGIETDRNYFEIARQRLLEQDSDVQEINMEFKA